MKKFAQLLLLFILVTGSAISSFAQTLSQQLDAMLSEYYPANEPGAAIIVSKEGKVIYKKAFGKANLELDIPLSPESVFEIGSISKQMTAIGIIMLQEKGKLSLQDPLNKYIPDYPNGEAITIHQLLTHTSGVKSYTDMPSFSEIWRNDLTVDELINVFKHETPDFKPGEQWNYSNSGYILLGYIIEKASEMSYEDFVVQKIFKPLGMENSYYGSKSRIIKNRATGYQSNEKDELENAEYLSMTIPYAAGSIMSTVGDLNIWTMAIRDNKLISQKSKELAFSDSKLNNGESTGYGYGFALRNTQGSPAIEHSGGIFGYTSNGIYLPKENVYVCILSNFDFDSPQYMSTKIAALVIGKPYKGASSAIKLSEENLKKFEGIYKFEDGVERKIFFEDGKLFSQRTGSGRFEIFPVSELDFIFDESFSALKFSEDKDGNIVKVVKTDRRNATTGVKTDKKILKRTEIKLEEKVLKQYVGDYELQPGFNIVVTLENGKLFAQATGQNKTELFAKAKDHFFLKVVDANIEFTKEKNDIKGLILRQGEVNMKGIKQ